MDFAWMLLSLAVVFGGSRLFTNGIEHVGRKLRLRHSTTGSLLASLGTDLPESIIALWAIFLGTQEGADVAMGAIVGAPLLLTTLALAISGAAALYYAWRRRRPSFIKGDDLALRSDLSFFLLLYPFVGLAGLMPPGHGGRWAIGMILVGCYVLYAYLAVRRSRGSEGWEREDDPRPLYLTRG
ncbi:MAG: hypothetical protein KM310_10405 [Clostridiales bacterium]|nr:hypothetical protein [Clostridiales bacterium]